MPNNLFVADFVGSPTMNFVEATAKQVNETTLDVDFHGIKAKFELNEPIELHSEEVVLGIRPEFIKIVSRGIPAIVYSSLPAGMETTVKIKFGENILTSVVFGIIDYPTDSPISISFIGDKIVLFDKESTKRLTDGKLKIKK